MLHPPGSPRPLAKPCPAAPHEGYSPLVLAPLGPVVPWTCGNYFWVDLYTHSPLGAPTRLAKPCSIPSLAEATPPRLPLSSSTPVTRPWGIWPLDLRALFLGGPLHAPSPGRPEAPREVLPHSEFGGGYTPPPLQTTTKVIAHSSRRPWSTWPHNLRAPFRARGGCTPLPPTKAIVHPSKHS